MRLLQAFAEAARMGSFARAARELGLSASAVTKSVQRLEEQVNLRLFHRTTRRIALTQEGEALYQQCRRVLDDLAELALLAAGTANVPTGVLRINVPVTYGKRVILPTLAQIARRYDDFRFEVQLSDQFVDVIGSGMDAVVRVGEIADPLPCGGWTSKGSASTARPNTSGAEDARASPPTSRCTTALSSRCSRRDAYALGLFSRREAGV